MFAGEGNLLVYTGYILN